MDDLFLIIVCCVFLVLLVVALVLLAIESRMISARKKLIGKKIASGRGMRLDGEEVCLKVTDGMVEIIDAAKLLEALQAAAPEQPPEAQPAPSEELVAAEIPAEVPAEEVSEICAVSDEDAEPPEPIPVPIGPEDEKLSELEGLVISSAAAVQSAECAAAAQPEEAEEDEGKTFVEKYAVLNDKRRKYFDDLAAYILSCPACRKEETSQAVIFKCGADDIAYASIKRGTLIVCFMLCNSQFTGFVRKVGTKRVKVTPVVVRVKSNADFVLAKQLAGIAFTAIRRKQLLPQ